MESVFAQYLGISPEIFHWVVVPILIFLARVTDVSINTLRVIFMLNGRRWITMLLGFCEAFIWLVAISQILKNINNVASYFAYAGGFAMGIFVGMRIEGFLAIGNVMVRVVAESACLEVAQALRQHNYRFTSIAAEGSRSTVQVFFLVIRRQHLRNLLQLIEKTAPQAFYTVEGVKQVSDWDKLSSPSDMQHVGPF